MSYLKRLLEQLWAQKGNEKIDQTLKTMLPGMLIEQGAVVLLGNVNVFVMGFISTAALAGVGQINTVNNILMNVFQAFSIGGTAISAQLIGAGRKKEASSAATAALLLGLAVSLIVTLLVYLFRKNIVVLLFGNADPEVIENSIIYFNYTALATILWFVYFQCCGFMRSAGNTRTPMIISIILNSISIILNLLLALVFKMGVQGSAIAYLVSVGLGAVLSFGLLFHHKSGIKPAAKFSISEFKYMKRIADIGFPSSAENLMFNGSRIVLQVFLAGMGTVMISANQVFNSVNEILIIPFMALYYLVVPIVGLHASNGDEAKIRKSLRFFYHRSLSYAIFISIAHLVLSVPLSYLFTRDAEVVRIAVQLLLMFALFSPFQASCFILPNGFKAVGDAKFAMVFSSITAWIIRVFGTWLLGVKFGWGVYAILFTQGLDYLARSAAYEIRYKGNQWLKYLQFSEDTKI